MTAFPYADHARNARMALELFRFALAALVLAAALSAVALAQSAGGGLIPIGSALTFGGGNAPDTYSATTTFSSTPVLVDNGAVKIWQVQVPTPPGGEWDVFYMQTVSGGPLAGNINGDWNITISYDLSQAVFFDQVVNQWLVNGTPVSPLTNGIGSICCATASNPIVPGESYYGSGFSGALAAGVQSNWNQIYVDPYSIVANGGVNPSTANQFIFALHFTPQGPVVGGVVSASAFGELPDFAPGSWIEIYGTSLASTTRSWTNADFNGVNGPTALSGTSVTVGGLQAFVDYISPTQVNVQVPGGVSTGAQSLVVTTAVGSSAPFPVTVNTTEPGLLAPANFLIGGNQNVVAQFADGTYVAPPGAISGVNSQRAQPGDEIVIYGIGFGTVSPNSPPGQLVESLDTLSDSFTMSFGGVAATSVAYEGLAPNFMGLYQFNVVVPSVAASDSVPLTFTLDGADGAQTLVIAVAN